MFHFATSKNVSSTKIKQQSSETQCTNMSITLFRHLVSTILALLQKNFRIRIHEKPLSHNLNIFNQIVRYIGIFVIKNKYKS